jgi:hypothetical protein
MTQLGHIMNKKLRIAAADIVRLVPHDGACLATDRITVDGLDVGYMYREAPANAADTGWRFFSGDESEDYVADSSNSGVYALNSIANCDPAVLIHLEEPTPCAFERVPGTREFRRVDR